eukprot:4927601-Prymnesium_polylepis.1
MKGSRCNKAAVLVIPQDHEWVRHDRQQPHVKAAAGARFGLQLAWRAVLWQAFLCESAGQAAAHIRQRTGNQQPIKGMRNQAEQLLGRGGLPAQRVERWDEQRGEDGRVAVGSRSCNSSRREDCTRLWAAYAHDG